MDPGYPTCYRHPDRQAGVICQRCDRPICPQCMHQASVGFHCPECTKTGAQKVYQGIGALQQQPIVTQVLIGLNVLVFVVALAVGGSEAASGTSSFNQAFGLIARAWQNAAGTGYYIGPVPGTQEIGVGAGQWYRVITYGFLQNSILFLFFNCYLLWSIGSQLETAIGRARFGLIYAMSLAAGALGGLLLEPQVMTAGASGAIFGLVAALFMAYRSSGIPLRNIPLFWMLGIYLLLSLLVPGFSAGVHLGGLAGGAIAGFLVFDLGRRPDLAPKTVLAGGVVLTAGLVVAAIALATAFQP